MEAQCRNLHAGSSLILHCGFYAQQWHNRGMELRPRIQALLDEKGLTVRGVSLRAGLSDSMLHKFMTGATKSMTVENLERVAGALDVSLRHLMFADPDDDNVSFIWDHIPSQRRKQALQVLETFADTEKQA